MSADLDEFVRRYVSSVGNPVTSRDVDTYERVSLIQIRAAKERGEQKLRLVYGSVLLALLVGQVIAVTTLAFFIGFGVISIDRWVATTFVGGTFGEVSGMAYLIVRYLFPVD
jgi:hypothetical protein